MSLLTEPKIDCHMHILDPARFPYASGSPYRPAGQEVGTLAQYREVMKFYGVRHALIVGPNSGYGLDNGCLLDALAAGPGRFRGIAVVPNDAGRPELEKLKARGIVGIAMNPTFHGVEHYRDLDGLVGRLAALGMFLQIQVQGTDLLRLMPLLDLAPVRLLIDHCGRPDPALGLDQAGFREVLSLGRAGRAVVKLSGYSKFSHEPYPHADTWPYIRALVEAFTLERCVWASDWPFLRAPERVDYGPLIGLVAQLFPDPTERRTLFWDTPRRLFGFGASD